MIRLPASARPSAFGLLLLLACASACTTESGKGTTGIAPPGCTSVSSAADSEAVRQALRVAGAGMCVELAASTYEGPFDIPAGAGLFAHAGARATITGGTATTPAVTVREGSRLERVDIVAPAGVGVAVRAANATVTQVNVTGAKSAAVAVLCRDAENAGCSTGTIALVEDVLEKSSLGLWVSGAHVVMTGGRSAEHASTSLSAAMGVVAQAGAKLDLDGVRVEKNEGTGVVVDGATTTASIKNAFISENAERGLWVQKVEGTLAAPAVRIEATELVKNRIVGVGALESRGIIIVGGRVAETVAAPIVTNLAGAEQVGDGIGLFAGSTDFRLDATALESNARAAGVIDGSDRGIIIVGGKVSAGASGLKLVIQNSKGADLQVPETDRTTPPAALGISAPKLSLPAVL